MGKPRVVISMSTRHKNMTSRERMLIAMRNGQPDRIPAAPDISNMIPCRLTGKPFWDIYLYQDPPLWQAYMDAVEYFGTDGWVYSLDGFDLSSPQPQQEDMICETVIVEQGRDRSGNQEVDVKPEI